MILATHGIIQSTQGGGVITNNYKIVTDDANKDYINVGQLLGGVRSFSFHMTLTEAMSSGDNIFNRNPSSGDVNAVRLQENSSGKIRFFINNGSFKSVISNSAFVVGTEYYLTFQVDPSTGMEMWVDGVKQTDVNSSITSPIAVSTTDSYFGGFVTRDERYVSQKIRNIVFWSDVRTGTEIASDMSTVFTGGEAGLIEFFELTEGSTATITGVKSNTGTLNTSNAGGLTYINSDMWELI